MVYVCVLVVYIYIYICICIHMCTYIYIYIYIVYVDVCLVVYLYMTYVFVCCGLGPSCAKVDQGARLSPLRIRTLQLSPSSRRCKVCLFVVVYVVCLFGCFQVGCDIHTHTPCKEFLCFNTVSCRCSPTPLLVQLWVISGSEWLWACSGGKASG